MISENKKCCSEENHGMHVCTMKEEGYDQLHPEEFKKITDDPQYKCDNCGATVHNSENVCNPMPLKKEQPQQSESDQIVF